MLLLAAGAAVGQLAQGKPAPSIHAVDIHGKAVDLDALVQEQPYLVILYFFSVDTGEDIAVKLRYLDMRYGRDKLKIISLGMKEDEAALKAFADRLNIQYFLIHADSVENAPWLKEIYSLPLTLFVQADPDKTIERVLVGGGAGQAQILKEVAENLYQQRRGEALEIVEEAIAAGEDAKEAAELKGFILTTEGKLDEAEKEFGRIDSVAGLAAVALERGDLESAAQIAASAPDDGYAQTVRAEALIRTGKTAEAAEALNTAATAAKRPWQQSETVNLQGRVAHIEGDADKAVAAYQQAIALDPYNVIALSNEGAAHREKGDLEKAQETLEKAARIRPDDLTEIMIRQVRRELEEANDLKRAELVNAQIAELGKRFRELKVSGAAEDADTWTSRPLVVAFLPSSARQESALFERAGTAVAVQREIEARLQSSGRMSVVERQMLDKLLQELNLGSSELADPATQRQLGRVLSAGVLAFTDFGRIGSDLIMYVRLVDTESTQIVGQVTSTVVERQPSACIQAVADELLEKLSSDRELRGLIADVSDPEAILINIGAKHGVEVGQVFTVLTDGEPVEAAGRVIARRQRPVAKLRVTLVEADYAVCTPVELREDVPLAKEMKVRIVR
ncbi:MAG TPA: tetratricopeptide repeat protein [Candidatus Hydrogenedentes bacterium]|nr:tetratricopeptide repeat protein [Candidatus Hydrogenedentota bacterium]